MTRPNKHRQLFSLYLDKAQLEKLHEIAPIENMTMSALIRNAVDNLIFERVSRTNYTLEQIVKCSYEIGRSDELNGIENRKLSEMRTSICTGEELV